MYKVIKTITETSIVKDSIMWIPQDGSNKDYREYLQWCSEGNEAEIVDMTGDDNE